ncbi:MAG: sigma-70 family RNA polymerase sigma factor [Candidatus Obscuribacterales bacterium]|nr:sigma-70 family RNA polymerase sigma factor [Candidatus Obscuribacterales bacterium]
MFRFQRKKHEQFKNAMYPHYSELFRFAYARLGNAQDAEDSLQETYLKAFRSFDSFKDDTGPKAWLSCILINTIRDHVRKVNRTPQTVSFEQVSQPDAIDAASDKQRSLDPAYLAGLDEIDPELLSALRELPDTFLSPLLLREINDASYQEIATTLEIPIGTVMSRLSRARTMLKKTLSNTHLNRAKHSQREAQDSSLKQPKANQ